MARHPGGMVAPPAGPLVGQALQPCFVAGELAPALYARFDLAKFHIGAKQMLNCFVAGQGGAYNRPGTQFLAFAKYPPPRVTRLIAFNFSVTQTYVLEFGYQYIRFITQGAYVVTGGGAIYEVATPYLDTDLALLKFAQANDVLTLTHPSYPPMDLKRLAAATWTLTPIGFGTSAVAPAGVTVGTYNDQAAIASAQVSLPISVWSYVVTTETLDPPDESLPSAAAAGANFDLGYWSQYGVYNVVSWQPVAGADQYNVYRLYQGIYGFVGSTTGLSLIDRNVLPDINTTPPDGNSNPFANGAITAVSIVQTGTYQGAIASATVTQSGSFTAVPTVTLYDPTGSGATLVPSLAAGVLSVAVDPGGANYTAPVAGASGPGATASIALAVETPALTLTDPTGTGAVLVPSVVNGALAIEIQNGGSNYTAPVITVNGGGAAATVTATLSGGANNPGCVAYYQQRRVFAGSTDAPDSLWLTRTGNITSMNVSNPVEPDDAITVTIAAQQDNAIQHIVPVQDMLLMTDGGCWKVGGGSQSDVVTPASVVVQPQIFNGCAPTMPPLVINYDILYVQEKGNTIRDLAYNFYVNLYTGTDITLLAWHLFYSYTLKEWAFAREPFKIVWVVRSDGTLLGLTYIKDQDVYAWHRHTTAGTFQSVATVGEGTEDVPYFVVQRTLNGQMQNCIERMHTRQLGVANADVTQGWFVDCGLQYSGAPVSSVSGLAYLAGETVAILADGSVQPQQVVPPSGTLTLAQPASTITVGLPYQSVLETLPLDLGEPTQQGKRKRISRVRAFVENTRGLKAGPVHPTKGPLLARFKERRADPWGAPTALQTGEEWINASGNWDIYGSVWFQQDDPLPMGLLGVELDFELGT